MDTPRSLLAAAAAIVLSACGLHSETLSGSRDDQPPRDLRTVAERSSFRATARYDEVNAFLKDLAAASPLVKLSDIGKSGEGRDIPLAWIADPPVSTPEEARRSGKLVVAMLGGIHAGECDGKEALLALARDLARHGGKDDPTPLAATLDSCIYAVIPIYNPDGNERMDPGNRQGQVGPDTMGKRENAAGLDLNRDFVKLEAPETRGLLRFINQCDPHILIDTHTTNGSKHRYPMTFDTNKHPAGDAALIDFARGTMMPAIAEAVKASDNLDTFWYGNFEKDHTVWESYPDDPRYGINYMGMRNRIGILTESYSYATYKERIEAQRAFLAQTLLYAAANKAKIQNLISEADRRASGSEAAARGGPAGPRGQRRRGPIEVDELIAMEEAAAVAESQPEPAPAQPPRQAGVALRSKMTAVAEKATVLGFKDEKPHDYTVDHLAEFKAEVTVARPAAYLFDASFTAAAQTLQRHGIRVEETREDIEVEFTSYTVDAVTKAMRPFQGHSLVSVKSSAKPGTRRFPAGSYLVRTGQPLGTLAAYLLEPGAADGLTTWNFFDDSLKVDGEFAVARLERSMPITAIAAADLPEDVKPPQDVTYQAAFESDRAPNFTGSPIGGVTWLDETHFLQSKDGRLYKVGAATGKAEPFIRPGPIAAALEKLPGVSARDAQGIANRTSFSWNADRSAFFFDHANDLYYCTMDGATASRLTSTPEAEETPTFSPDGKTIAFVRKNDLWVVDVATGTERALTTSGSETIRNGKADWVYWEEIFNRSARPYFWSPDSSRIAFFQIDSSPVKEYVIVNNIPEGQRVEKTQYPKVGTANPTAKFFTVQVAGGDPQEVDLAAYTPQDMWLANGGWFPDSSRCYVIVMNRFQTWADVLSAPADGGSPTKLFRETTGAWVDPPEPMTFLKDGSFLFRSERSGYKHFYHYKADGTLVAQLTSGEWEARSIALLDQDGGHLYFRGMKDNPIAENLYRVPLRGERTEPVRLTREPGAHRVDLSPKGTRFVDAWSSASTPSRTVLRQTDDHSIIRTLDTNPVRDLARYNLGAFELVQIKTDDGFILEGSILKPFNFKPSHKHPVWFMTYGGPQSPTVGDSWSARLWDHVLANAGFVVFRADPRPASGKGAKSAWTAYKQLGVQELADIETAIKWLSREPWVDSTRIGMAGHSYGGFMTSYALTHSKLFAAGIAGAPVTDWRLYDTCYTERFMLTPAENPDGYAKTSVVAAAANLHGKLLLLHGWIDDNVHLENTERLARGLQRANKQFEMMIYPEARHGLGGRHYQRLMYDFILRTLAPTEPASSERAQR